MANTRVATDDDHCEAEEDLLGIVPARMDYLFSWDDVLEVVELYLDRARGDGYLVLVGRHAEEHIGTLYCSEKALQGVIWRGLATARSQKWRDALQVRVRTYLNRIPGDSS